MDWSLCQPNASKRFLRDVRGYKGAWPYYVAMIIDPILRFNWVFYVVYTHDPQYSSIASFLVAFSEVSRRGMWTLFRVENEHCANVEHFKASRDIPLPYQLGLQEADTFTNEHQDLDIESPEPDGTTAQASPQLSRRRTRASGTDVAVAEEGEAGPSPQLRRRGPTRAMTLTKIFAEAHMQDFEKRKVGGGNSLSRKGTHDSGGYDEDGHGYRSSDDDEDDGVLDADIDADTETLFKRHRSTRRRDEDIGDK
jgi:hypothetical protein